MITQMHTPRWVTLLLMAGVASASSLFGETDVDGTRALIEQWVETRRIAAEERSQWEVEKAAIADLMRVLKAEQETLTGRIARMQAELSESDATRADLVARRDALAEATVRFGHDLTAIEKRLVAMAPRLPSLLRDDLRLTIEQLNQSTRQSGSVPLVRRVQNVLAFLAAVETFDRSIHVRTGVLERSDGRSQEVSLIFIGLGAGFFSNEGGDYCGRMVLGTDGWQAQPDPALANALGEFLAIWHDPAKAHFVSVPVAGVPLIQTEATE